MYCPISASIGANVTRIMIRFSLKTLIIGSDGMTYDNECEMRVSACKKSQFVTVATRGPCDVCHNVHCKYGARCENGRLRCPTECPDVSESICGNDSTTYANECEMRSASCRKSTDISVKFYGDCDDISPILMVPDLVFIFHLKYPKF